MKLQYSEPRVQMPILAMCVLAAVVFFTGITWGLPSSAADKYLYGNEPVWSGEKIQQLAGGWSADPARGADVDLNPLAHGDKPIVLNETDAQRAEIIRRYRLYTYQPDEMITMRALSGMRPSEGRLDPRLYQYGGLWIYPVGGLLKLEALVGHVTLKSDVAWYLDHPAEFGKFYVRARVCAAVWGLVGLWAVFQITRRLMSDSVLPAAFAGMCYACMPVVINMAHEAKPHLPGAALQLLAILSAMRYVETGRRASWITTGVLCGAAFGMVLSAWPIFIVLPVMVLLRPQPWPRAAAVCVGGGAIGIATYLVTNPYIVINLFINREVLHSNFGNSLAMYAIGRWPAGLVNAGRLVAEGASPTVALIGTLAAIVGLAGYIIAARRAADQRAPSTPTPPASDGTAKYWLLLAAPAVVILLQFTALAAGKPGEYGRFAVLPDVVLAIAAVGGITRTLQHRTAQTVALAALFFLTAVPGYVYLSGFIADSSGHPSRLGWARIIGDLNNGGCETMGVNAEPAPYGLPPVNLFTWRLVLVPPGTPIERIQPEIDVVVKPVEAHGPPQQVPESYVSFLPVDERLTHDISWANKRFSVWVRRSLFPADTAPATAPSDRSF